MTPMKRPLAAAGAAVLLALSLSACGGAPTDASKADYCKVVKDETNSAEFLKAYEDKDWDKVADLIKDQVGKIEDVGTPDDISDDAREGFEIQVDAAKGISGDDVEKAVEKQEDPFEADLSSDDKKKVEAYTAYESKTCSDTGDSSEVPSTSTELPSTPTEVPSDLPSGLPSDLGTDLPTSPEDLASLQSELENLTEGLPTE